MGRCHARVLVRQQTQRVTGDTPLDVGNGRVRQYIKWLSTPRQAGVQEFNYNGTFHYWFFYYDPLGRLAEARYSIGSSTSIDVSPVSVHSGSAIGSSPTFKRTTRLRRRPSATSVTDETQRPVEMWTWPASGNAAPVWAIDPSAWGFDTNVLGPNVYQPLLFAGQYQDQETASFRSDGTTLHQPGLVLNGFRTYDPFTGSYLQVDPLVAGYLEVVTYMPIPARR